MKNLILSVTTFLVFLVGSHAMALTGYPGFNIGLGYGFGPGSDSGDSYNSERAQNVSFFALGTTHEKGMYLGFRYEQQKLKYTGSQGNQNSQGATIGIGQNGCYMLAHYFWKVSRDLESGSVDGTGNGFDFGYQFPFFYQNFLTMGLQYSIRHTKYDDINARSTTLHVPMLVFGGNF